MKKKLVYLSVTSSLIGASTLSLNLRLFQLSIFRISIILISLIMLIEILSNKGSIVIKTKENNYSIIFMLIWTVYAFFSLGWVKDYSLWVKALYFISLGFLCTVTFSRYLRDKYDILTIFRLMTIMIIFHNLIGWYEIKTGNYLFLSLARIKIYVRDGYPVSVFGNTNDFATFMLFSVFITYICIVNAKNLISKSVYIATIISSVSLLVASKSRANILGLIIAAIVFLYFMIRNSNRQTKFVSIILLTTSIIAILNKPELINHLYVKINEILQFNFLKGSGSDVTRLNLIKNGLVFLTMTYGLGTGAGNIEYWMDNYRIYYTGSINNVHNWWMEILVGYGLIIFFMYIVFYIILFYSMYKKLKKSEDKIDFSLALGIMCCMVGYIVGSISSSSNINTEWLWLFWAIAIAYQGISVKISAEES